MTLIRLILGKLILLLNWVFTPRSITREPAQQALIDGQTASLILYQYQACPFCVKVRRAMKRQGLKIGEDEHSVHWMYESKDILGYLEARFSEG
jgi:hypothetical protein